jgi:hypothetical protein
MRGPDNRLWYDSDIVVASILLFTNCFDFYDDEDVSSCDGLVCTVVMQVAGSTTSILKTCGLSTYGGIRPSVCPNPPHASEISHEILRINSSISLGQVVITGNISSFGSLFVYWYR